MLMKSKGQKRRDRNGHRHAPDHPRNHPPLSQGTQTMNQTTESLYNTHKIAAELDSTALGVSYNGAALQAAKSMQGLTPSDIACLDRWLKGDPADSQHLQRIAMKLRDNAPLRERPTLTHVTVQPKPHTLGDGFDAHQDEASRQARLAYNAPAILAELKSLCFVAESAAHLRGLEATILPHTDKARALIERIEKGA